MTDISTQQSNKVDRKQIRKIRSNVRLGFHNTIKRMMDLVLSFLGLILTAPLFGLIAIGIKLDSKGPVYFRGDRVGRDGKLFKMLKFRTMYETEKSYNGPSITGEGDERITPFGGWLRDTKLNELPQLWNVFIGEMSLVGPRPEVPDVVEKWPEDVRKEVLSVRPGITSPASVVYRNEEKMLETTNILDKYMKQILPDKLRLDQLYVRNFSVLSDFDVIFMTMIALLPAVRQAKFKERSFYAGLFYRMYHGIFSWFFVDFFVTTLMVGISGIVWRISTVINLGAGIYLVIAIGMALLISLINFLLGLNTIQWTTASPTYVLDIGFSIGITCTVLWAINRYIVTDPWIPFSMFWLIGVMTFIGLVAVRYRERLFTGIANRWLLLRKTSVLIGERVLVVGAGELGEMAVWLLHRSRYRDAFGIVGIVDDDPKKQGLCINGYRVLDETNKIPDLVEKYDVGLIIFAISNIQERKLKKLLEICRGTSAKVIEIPDLVKVFNSSLREQTA